MSGTLRWRLVEESAHQVLVYDKEQSTDAGRERNGAKRNQVTRWSGREKRGKESPALAVPPRAPACGEKEGKLGKRTTSLAQFATFNGT